MKVIAKQTVVEIVRVRFGQRTRESEVARMRRDYPDGCPECGSPHVDPHEPCYGGFDPDADYIRWDGQ